jgi:hypothetical protein
LPATLKVPEAAGARFSPESGFTLGKRSGWFQRALEIPPVRAPALEESALARFGTGYADACGYTGKAANTAAPS